MHIILMGAQGAGKGTQAELLGAEARAWSRSRPATLFRAAIAPRPSSGC